MADLFLLPSALLYLAVVGLLFIFGVNFFYLTWIAGRDRAVPPVPPEPKEWPRLTVQLPIYNELYVAERLIRAAAALDYPRGLLEIQVLDDSTDETTEIVRRLVEQLCQQGVDIIHLHRTDRSGFKAGALAEGLPQAKGEFLAIFDADFIPPADFLRRTLPHFADPQIGFVQTRWGHVNQEYSFLTLLQSLAIDGHFMVEQFARCRAGHWFNFNGTAGVWRRAAMVDAGGWQADTLTEDLDLSYRAFFRGWRGLYLREIEVPAELPVSISAYRRQQHRWARGSLECARKYLPQLWKAPIPLSQKVQASLHLTGYGVHLLLCALLLLYPFMLLLHVRHSELAPLLGFTFIFNTTAIAPTIFFSAAQRQLDPRWWRRLPAILFLAVLGSGMMLNTVRAALQILANSRGVFERTPKFGITQKNQNWTGRRYQLRLDPIVFFELALSVLTLATSSFALSIHNWPIAFYSAIFAAGLLFTSSLTIVQEIQLYRNRIQQVAS
jgi:cellulose synthase/poly-beta-1,6-N-acetylglucosamine synthase-like glycosyltransferase